MRRRVVGSTDNTHGGDLVHRWRASSLKWRLTVECRLGFVGTTVGNNDDVFHESNRDQGGDLIEDSKPLRRISNGRHFGNLASRGCCCGFGGLVGHDDNRNRLLVGGGRFVLINGGD